MAAENQDMSGTAPVGVTGSVGALLRETRERRGQDLGFVASALRIRQPYLQAIEEGRSDDLPGSTYAVGFVRGYADYLGLDSKEIVRRFRQENGEFANRAELVFPSAVSEGSIPTGALLAVAVLAAAAAYGAWYWYQSRDPSLASAVPALPERLAALIHQPVGSGSELVAVDGDKAVDNSKVNEVPQPPAPVPAAAPSFPTVSASSPSVVASSVPSSSGPAHVDVVPPAEDDLPVTAPAATSAAPATTGASDGIAAGGDVKSAEVAPDEGKPVKDAKGKAKGRDAKPDLTKAPVVAPNDAASPAVGDAKPADAPATVKLQEATPAEPSRVVMRAKEDCWIEIRDANGKIVQNRLLRKGEVYSVPSRPGLKMTAGNAGALAMLVDGKAAPALGRLGMVRRAVSLDAERLKEGEGVAPEPVAPDPVPTETPVPSSPNGASGTE
ncbi:MAG TPA: helix-turn-helix domain-containing protein [Telmatospirillum sp.]|nr:helix-turn-helix domain-containing protein [Telmatospirillum sp.]